MANRFEVKAARRGGRPHSTRRQMGINIFAGGRTARLRQRPASTPAQSREAVRPVQVSNPLDVFLYNSKLNVGVTIQDLEQKQVLQVLAGAYVDDAKRHDGALPVRRRISVSCRPAGRRSRQRASVTIQFRPYGVKVEFTPTVNPDGSIHLKLAPEVSALDYGNSVSVSGFTIPALSTRRAETEVEILDGETFVVSGLLDHRTTELVSSDPGHRGCPHPGWTLPVEELQPLGGRVGDPRDRFGCRPLEARRSPERRRAEVGCTEHEPGYVRCVRSGEGGERTRHSSRRTTSLRPLEISHDQ